MQNTIKQDTSNRLKAVIVLGATVIVLTAFAFWGGVPTDERITVFWAATAVLVVILLAFGWLTWHLLFRPLPAGQKVSEQPLNASVRQSVALLIGVGGLSIIVGAFWDEIWHRQYGIPLGEDLLWRPHLMMYFGFAVTTLLAFAGLYLLNRNGKGTLQQRFRANPIIGMLILVGGFLMYVLPADPVWHTIYGDDITALSIPHLLLILSFIAIFLLSAAIHLTTLPERAWGGPLGLRLNDLLPLLMFAAMILLWLQFFTTEADAGATFEGLRPEWLLPGFIVIAAAGVGTIANHSLRRWGAATLAGLLALVIRFALIQLFGADNMRLSGWVLVLAPLVALDLWYALSGRLAWPRWLGAGIAAGLGMALVGLPLLTQFYPQISFANLPVTVIVLMLVSLAGSWLGASAGDYLAAANKAPDLSREQNRLTLLSLGAYAAVVVFILVFVTTATPPV